MKEKVEFQTESHSHLRLQVLILDFLHSDTFSYLRCSLLLEAETHCPRTKSRHYSFANCFHVKTNIKCRLLLSRKPIIAYHQSRSHPPSTPHPRTNSLKQINGFERAFYNCSFKELLSKLNDVYKSRRCSTRCECATADACHELTFLLEQLIKGLKLRNPLAL